MKIQINPKAEEIENAEIEYFFTQTYRLTYSELQNIDLFTLSQWMKISEKIKQKQQFEEMRRTWSNRR